MRKATCFDYTSGINEANARLGGYEEDIIHRQNTKLTMTLYKYYESDNDIAQLMQRATK